MRRPSNVRFVSIPKNESLPIRAGPFPRAQGSVPRAGVPTGESPQGWNLPRQVDPPSIPSAGDESGRAL